MKVFSYYFQLFFLFIIIVTINPFENSWAIDIKKMVESNNFEEYIDGTQGIKWGAQEIDGGYGNRTIAGVPYKKSGVPSPWTKIYYTSDNRALMFFDGELFAFALFLNENETNIEIKKIKKKFGDGMPGKSPTVEEWRLKTIHIIFDKLSNGSNQIRCFHVERSAEREKHRLTKDLYFKMVKKTIYVKNKKSSHDILPQDPTHPFIVYGKIIIHKAIISHILSTEYGVDELYDCDTMDSPKKEKILLCLVTRVITSINYYYTNLYDYKEKDLSWVLDNITKEIGYINNYGDNGKKAISFIDEYDKFVEKNFKEKIAQKQ